MTETVDLFGEEVPWASPQRCDDCGRFVSASEAVFLHDYGDYGHLNNVEIFCKRGTCPVNDKSHP